MVSHVQACSVVLLIVLLAAAIFCPIVSASQRSAQNIISTANETVKKCYLALQQAQSAGANVDTLMETLNNATAALSKAGLAYASGDFDSAYLYAAQSQSTLAGFTDQANAQAQAALAADAKKTNSIFLSLAVSAAILLSGITLWAALHRRERRLSLHGSTTV